MPFDLTFILSILIPFIIIYGIMYFVMMRPEKKRRAEVMIMQSELQKDDKIITIGGIHGIITDVKDDVVTIATADGSKIKIDKVAIKIKK